ncbi:MAG: hypothetical protein ACO1N7_03310, partial [Sphingobacteriaceae bacterium]
FVAVLVYLSQLEPSISTSSVSSVLSIGQAAKNKDIKSIFYSVTSVNDPEKLSDLYKIYEYQPNTGEFLESPSSDKLEIRFPSAEGKLTNDAVFIMTYVASNVKATVDGESAELPASVTASLKVKNKDVLKLTSSYEYKTDGTPTKVDVNLLMGVFALKTKVTNDASSLNSEMTFYNGTEALVSLKASGNGNLSVAKVDGADEDVSEIVTNANASFEIMNIKLAAQIDFKGISNETSGNLTDSLENIQETAAWNKYAKFAVVNKNDNTIIAKLEFVPESDRSCYPYFDYSTNTMVENCHTDHYMGAKFVFKDGSSISEGNFDDSDFTKLIDAFEDFSEKFD